MAYSTQLGTLSPPAPDFKLVAEPRLDLFLTPSNDHFYSRSPYRRLNSESEIRLLRVFPEVTYKEYIATNPGRPRYEIADDRKLVACELLDNVKVARADGRYVAISYHAGDPRDTALILVNGIPFNAFANLEFAIRTVMSSWNAHHPGKELFLWTDQICINQNDFDERSAQVTLMPQVYCRSLETNVCLATRVSTPCLRWIPQVDKDIPKTISIISSRFYSEIGEQVANRPKQYTYSESLAAFMNRPWWRRAWVYQEFMLSPRLYFLCHGSRMSLNDVSSSVDILNSNKKALFDFMTTMVAEEEKEAKRAHQHVVQQYRQRCHDEWKEAYQKQESYLLKEVKTWKMWERERATKNKTGYYSKYDFRFQPALMRSTERNVEDLYEDFQQAYSVFLGQADEMDVLRARAKEILVRFRESFPVATDFSNYTPNLRPPAELEPTFFSTFEKKRRHIDKLQEQINQLNISAVVSMIDAKKAYANQTSLDLKELLRHSRGCNASDDRDRIYAFLGLANKAYNIKPNYSKENTAVRVLIETAKAIIMHDQDLSILADVDRGGSKYSLYLPTWVPDWLGRAHGASIAGYISSIIPKSETRAIHASPAKLFHAEFQHHNDSDDVDMKVTGVFVDDLSALSSSIEELEELQHLRTQKGARVVASKRSGPRDQVWVLYGAKRPVVLRALGADRYSFRGEACILLPEDTPALSTVMFGEMMQLVEEGKATAKEIWLV